MNRSRRALGFLAGALFVATSCGGGNVGDSGIPASASIDTLAEAFAPCDGLGDPYRLRTT